MKHPFPYPPISTQALEAMARIERATSLKGLDDDFNTVQAEAFRQYGVSLLIAVLTALPVSAAFIAAQQLGWFGSTEVWQYGLIPLVVWALTPAIEFLLRGPRRVEDERRLRDTLNVWKVLERKGKET